MAKFSFILIAFAVITITFASKTEKKEKDDLDTAAGSHYGVGHGVYGGGYAQLYGYGGNSYGHGGYGGYGHGGYGGYGHGHFAYGVNQAHPSYGHGGYGHGGYGHGGYGHGGSHIYHQQSYSGYYPSHSFGYGHHG